MTVVQVDLPAGMQPDADAVGVALTAASLPPDDARVNGRALHVLYRRDLTDAETNTVRSVAVETVFSPPIPPAPESVLPQRVADLEGAVQTLERRLAGVESRLPVVR